jgi:D-alanine-D-alanine ligase
MHKKYSKITILAGGVSSERAVSLVSGQKSLEALKEKNYNVSILDTAEKDWITQLIQNRPDAVLNMLHGRIGEDGIVQGVLEALQIPYTHSGVKASAVAMDKVLTKTILASYGLPVPKGFVAHPKDILKVMQQKIQNNILHLPVVIKPINEGSSVGVIVAHEIQDLFFENLPLEIQKYDILMIEEFIQGREMTVSVFQDKPMTVTEILMPETFYDYKAKYSKNGSRHVVPAEIPQADFDLMMQYALKAHQVLNCKGVTRTDFRYGFADSPVIFILEINTQPGMTSTSLVPEQAQYTNIDYPTLVALMVEDASCNR